MHHVYTIYFIRLCILTGDAVVNVAMRERLWANAEKAFVLEALVSGEEVRGGMHARAMARARGGLSGAPAVWI